MVLTALLVHQVVHILQLLVLLEPMPLAQHRVIHVPVVLTALLVPQVVHILQLLVLLAPMPVALLRAKHAPVVLTALLVHPVVHILQRLVLLEPMPVVQHRVINVTVVLTALLVQAPVLDALRVALEKDKRPLALRHQIVFVLKTFVLVPMALQQRVQHALHMVLTFVRLVPVNITKLATPALDAL